MKDTNEISTSNSVTIDNTKMRKHLLILGITVSILILWNGVCDYIYVYSSQLSGDDYSSSAVFKVMRNANGRPHWMVMSLMQSFA